MKRLTLIFCIFLSLSLLLSGCEKKPDTPAELTFPGLEWGMSQEEVIAALSLKEGDYERDDGEQGVGTILVNAPLLCFGAETSHILLYFNDIQSYDIGPCLVSIEVNYPEGTDIQTVRRTMENYYGPSLDPDNDDPWDERVNHHVKQGSKNEGHLVYWQTQEVLGDVLSEEIKQEFYVMDGDPLNPEPGKQFNYGLKNALCEVYWADHADYIYQNLRNLPEATFPSGGYLMFKGGDYVAAYDWLPKLYELRNQ